MSVVAVAGGTGHLGRTIVETLQNTTDYNVITLSQKVRHRNISEVLYYSLSN